MGNLLKIDDKEGAKKNDEFGTNCGKTEWIKSHLRCPCSSLSALTELDGTLTCVKNDCPKIFPIIRGRPVLINDDESIFRAEDFNAPGNKDEAAFRSRNGNVIRRIISRILPEKTYNITDFSARDALSDLASEKPGSRVLIIGAGAVKYDFNNIDVLYTDVSVSDVTDIIADAHRIPFESDSFDAVFAVAVLEHVADPYRCVSEIERVLKADGLVYAVTPFMQPVHLGPYDFTRFTFVGHRRLFRNFRELRSGIDCGPATTAVWALESLSKSIVSYRILKFISLLFLRTLGWMVHFLERLLLNKKAALEAASAFYFYGRKSTVPLTDRELIKYYEESSLERQ